MWMQMVLVVVTMLVMAGCGQFSTAYNGQYRFPHSAFQGAGDPGEGIGAAEATDAAVAATGAESTSGEGTK